MPPRVLRVITRLTVSGPSTHVLLVDRGLGERGWETLLVHGTVEPGEVEYDLADVRIARRRVPAMGRAIRPVADMRSLASLARIIRHYRPDIIHTHQSKAGLLTRSAALIASPSTPRIHTFHGTLFAGYFGSRATQAVIGAERFLGRRTSRVIAISQLQRDELIAHRIAPPDRIAVIPLGLDLDRFRGLDRAAARSVLGVPEEALAVVSIGRLVAIKRVDRLIRVFASVAPAHPRAHLYVVGDGIARVELERQAAAAGLGDRVTFVGRSADAPRWYAAADLVVLTSDQEGTPLSLIEAAAASRPVLATDVGGVRDIVVDGITGLVVASHDRDGLAGGLSRLLTDTGLRATLGAAASQAAGRFDATRLVDELDRLYRDVLAELHPRTRNRR